MRIVKVAPRIRQRAHPLFPPDPWVGRRKRDKRAMGKGWCWRSAPPGLEALRTKVARQLTGRSRQTYILRGSLCQMRYGEDIGHGEYWKGQREHGDGRVQLLGEGRDRSQGNCGDAFLGKGSRGRQQEPAELPSVQGAGGRRARGRHTPEGLQGQPGHGGT